MATLELTTLLAEREITRVILRYARAVDGLDFERLRSCFHPDARISYGDLFSGDVEETLAWLKDSLSRLRSTLHDFGPPLIDLDLASGTAECETYSTNAVRYPEDENGEAILSVSGVRYLDRFALRDGAWRIVERRNVSCWSQNAPERPAPTPPYQTGGPLQR